MLTRRQLIAGLGSAAISGGIVSSTAAFTATSSNSTASFTVVAPNYIELRAVNDPPIHVETNDDGIVTKLTPGNDTGLNEYAITRFEDIVEVHNVSSVALSGLYFDFVVESESDTLSSSDATEIEETLSVTAGSETLTTTGESGDDLLAVSDAESAADGILSSGEESVPFGVQVDLIPDSGESSLSDLPDPNDFSATLRVIVETEE
ncbi:hypothetical protein [Halobellus rubicundus]|uniref:DUF1102 domain-containing protein n=1 Tax=Halobellus rubicundus TaxID=2996466 RepID=A0ABD5MAD3_9EURY